ncbi:MAG: SBBP repeat-containing protein [Microcystaceae cyanobacterium]
MNNYLDHHENSAFSTELTSNLSLFNDGYHLASFSTMKQQGANLEEIDSLEDNASLIEQTAFDIGFNSQFQATYPDLIGFTEIQATTTQDLIIGEYGQNEQPWSKQIGTVGVDRSNDIVTDSQGNIYLTGSTEGNLGSSNKGRRDIWMAKYDVSGNQQWLQQLGSSSYDDSYVLAVDTEDNIYFVGSTKGNLGTNNLGDYDAWIAKYASDGNQQWLQQLGKSEADYAYSLAIDANNNLYVTGATEGNLGGTNGGERDGWIGKYDSDGNQQWLKQIGTANYDYAQDVTFDNLGNIYIVGATSGDLGGVNNGQRDGWISKYDQNGNQQWLEQFGTTDDDYAYAVTVDSNNNLYVTGATGGNLGSNNLGERDAYLVKFDQEGNQIWKQQFGTDNYDYSYGIAIDSSNNLYLTGLTKGDLEGENVGDYDAWIAKYNNNGHQQWLKQFGSSSYDRGDNLAIDSNDNIYLTGFTEGSLYGDNLGEEDIWLRKLIKETETEPALSTISFPLGGSLTLDGKDDSLSYFLDEPETEVTHEFLFKTIDGNSGLFSLTDNVTTRGGHDRHIYLENGNIKARLWNNEIISSNGLNLADNKWYHVAHVFGSSVGGQKLYIDGELVAEGTKTESNFDWQSHINIGYSVDAQNDYLRGQIDEVRVWNVAKTQAEIQASMNQELTGNEDNLIGYWDFDDTPINSNQWNVSFINRNADNIFYSYDFSEPDAVMNLGSQNGFTYEDNPFETLTVDARTNGSTNKVYSSILEEGKHYKIEVSGIWTPDDRISGWSVDARFVSRDDWQTTTGDIDTTFRNYDFGLYSHNLGLNNDDIWGEYNPAHIYTYDVIGQGKAIDFYVQDSGYSDNLGTYTVKIYQESDVIPDDDVIRFNASFGEGSPAANIQQDYFALQAWTRINLEEDKIYQITTQADDASRYFLRKVTNGEIINIVPSWQTEDIGEYYFNVHESGEYDFYVQYYEQQAESFLHFNLTEVPEGIAHGAVASLNLNDYELKSYGINQNQDKDPIIAAVENQGTTLHLKGNTWKAIDFPYTITPNTVLEFDVLNTAIGEGLAIGFDNNLNNDSGDAQKWFNLYGTQVGGFTNYDFFNYADSAGQWKHYTIPVGHYDTGEMNYLLFINDHDVANPTAESFIANIKVYEADGLWKAEYYDNNNLEGNPISIDLIDDVSYSLGHASPSGVPQDFSARYTSYRYFEPGFYNIKTSSDDGIKVTVDNQLIIDKWNTLGHFSGTFQSTGQVYPIVVEYRDTGLSAHIDVDIEALTPWKAEYFNNTDLSGDPVYVEEVEAGNSITQNWGSGSPNNDVNVDNFSVRYTSDRYLAPGLYQIKTTADDGIRLKIGNQWVINKYSTLGSFTNYFRSEGGYYPIQVEYRENGGLAHFNFDITPYQPYNNFGDPNKIVNQWKASFYTYQWDDQQKAPVFDSGDRIGTVNLGNSRRSDGQWGMNAQNWGNGSPASQVTADNFVMDAYTRINFTAGHTYELWLRSDDGYRIWAHKLNGSAFNITDDALNGNWMVDAFGSKKFTFTAPESGTFDLHAQMYEGGGNAYFDLVIKDVSHVNGYFLPNDIYNVWKNYQLGTPTSNVIDHYGWAKYQYFNHPTLGTVSVVRSDQGTYPLWGGIRQQYLKEGGLFGWLGAPRSAEKGIGNGVVRQDFANGYILWDGSAKSYRHNGSSGGGYYNGYFVAKDIYDVWQKYQLGTVSSALQYHTATGSQYQYFKHPTLGTVSVVRSKEGVYPLWGGIRQHYLKEGGLNGWLGAPKSAEKGIGNGVVRQDFANGYVLWDGSAKSYRPDGSFNGGTFNGYFVPADFYAVWQAYKLGTVTSNVISHWSGAKYQYFKHSTLGTVSVVKSQHGIYPLWGGIRFSYVNRTGGLNGPLGAPTSAEHNSNGVVRQNFANGYILWKGYATAYKSDGSLLYPPSTPNPNPPGDNDNGSGGDTGGEWDDPDGITKWIEENGQRTAKNKLTGETEFVKDGEHPSWYNYEILAKEYVYDDMHRVQNFDYYIDQVIKDYSTGLYALGLYSKTGKPPVLVFRGTNDLLDVADDLNPQGIGRKQFDHKKIEIRDWLVKAERDKGIKPDVIGHSLGGALAQLTATEWTDKVGKVVTFNTPGIGSQNVNDFIIRGGYNLTVVHYITEKDPVSYAGESFLPGTVIKIAGKDYNIDLATAIIGFINITFGVAYSVASAALENHLDSSLISNPYRQKTKVKTVESISGISIENPRKWIGKAAKSRNNLSFKTALWLADQAIKLFK